MKNISLDTNYINRKTYPEMLTEQGKIIAFENNSNFNNTISKDNDFNNNKINNKIENLDLTSIFMPRDVLSISNGRMFTEDTNNIIKFDVDGFNIKGATDINGLVLSEYVKDSIYVGKSLNTVILSNGVNLHYNSNGIKYITKDGKKIAVNDNGILKQVSNSFYNDTNNFGIRSSVNYDDYNDWLNQFGIKAKMTKMFPDANLKQMRNYLINISHDINGISLLNTLFVEFEGRELDFQNIFGFPMYSLNSDGTKKYNYELVYLNFYEYLHSKYNNDELLKLNYISLKDEFTSYLLKNNIKISDNEFKIDKSKEEIIKKYNDLLKDNEQILIRVNDVKIFDNKMQELYSVSNETVLNIVGVTDYGFIVSCNGMQGYLPFSIINKSKSNAYFLTINYGCNSNIYLSINDKLKQFGCSTTYSFEKIENLLRDEKIVNRLSDIDNTSKNLESIFTKSEKSMTYINSLFNMFKNKEHEFEKIFGYPMYTIEDGDIHYNYEYMLIDFFYYYGNNGCDSTLYDGECSDAYIFSKFLYDEYGYKFDFQKISYDIHQDPVEFYYNLEDNNENVILHISDKIKLMKSLTGPQDEIELNDVSLNVVGIEYNEYNVPFYVIAYDGQKCYFPCDLLSNYLSNNIYFEVNNCNGKYYKSYWNFDIFSEKNIKFRTYGGYQGGCLRQFNQFKNFILNQQQKNKINVSNILSSDVEYFNKLIKDGKRINIELKDNIDVFKSLDDDAIQLKNGNLEIVDVKYNEYNVPFYEIVYDNNKYYLSPDTLVGIPFENLSIQIFNSDGSIFNIETGNYEDIVVPTVIKKFYEYYPGATLEQCESFFRKIKSTGCGYTALVNTIFKEYEGREKEFEEKFGFPMYYVENGNIVYNYDILILDCFHYTYSEYSLDDLLNKSDIITDFFRFISGSNEKGVSTGSDKNTYNKFVDFMKEKYNIDITVNYVKDDSLFNKFVGGTKVSDLANIYENNKTKDNQIIIGAWGYDLYNEYGDLYIKSGGGHAMYVTGVTEQGDVIVSSWGKKCTLKHDTTIDRLQVEVIEYDK